jgi:hypothetical protein
MINFVALGSSIFSVVLTVFLNYWKDAKLKKRDYLFKPFIKLKQLKYDFEKVPIQVITGDATFVLIELEVHFSLLGNSRIDEDFELLLQEFEEFRNLLARPDLDFYDENELHEYEEKFQQEQYVERAFREKFQSECDTIDEIFKSLVTKIDGNLFSSSKKSKFLKSFRKIC